MTTQAAWRTRNAAWLTTSLRRLRLRLLRHAVTQRDAAQSSPVADWLVAGDPPDPPSAGGGTAAGRSTAAALDERIGALGQQLSEIEAAMEQESSGAALPVLGELAGLSRFEEELLLLAAAPALDAAFAAAFAELHDDVRRESATLQLALRLFAAPEDRIVAPDCLVPARPLRRLRLVDVRDAHEPLLLRELSVDDRMSDYLRGLNRPDSRLEAFLNVVPDASPSATTNRAAAAIVALVEREAGTWPTVNVIGAADAGGMDAVHLASARLGLRPRRLEVERFAATDPTVRGEVVSLLGREALLANVALVVDGAHHQQSSEVAGVIDELVRTLAAPLFLLSADRWRSAGPGMDVVRVARPDRGEQRSLWRSALAGHPHSVNGEVDAIVQQFDLGAAAIAEVVDRAAREADPEITGPDLWNACRDQSASELDDLARRIVPSFCWDDIVVGDDVRAQLEELAGQVPHRAQVYDGWGFGAQLARGRGITALFAGPSGTGKTMAAEILAGDLRLDLHRVDLAGVVSKYVGETEKNLRRVFDAAERSGSILLFDEADALFGTRTDVRDSHDRYANLEINYLLQRMEDYSGLAILATNRRSALDGAFLRRLRFVVEFPFPAATDRRRIWERVFPAEAALDGIDPSQLSRLEIAGGNIRSIALNAAFLAATDDVAIGMDHVMRAAAREYAKLAKPISAAEFGPWLTVARS
ncbi:ATP-binding protein [Geodermatophilus sp. URMC 62]|uniref:ATP-binding protein n=1 Tax=Geodermatophilus sp. URMC 62 TaxID=3423414 RepID=UPI00406C1A87